MLTITTQDGRKLLLADGDKVTFEAGLYVSRVNRGYVSAKIAPAGFKNKNVTYIVTLGEYVAAPEWNPWGEAKKAAKAVQDALETGATEHTMLGNRGYALKDDLMASIAALNVLYSQVATKGWELHFGMINGKTNGDDSFYINPDADGSYAEAVKSRYAEYQKEIPEEAVA